MPTQTFFAATRRAAAVALVATVVGATVVAAAPGPAAASEAGHSHHVAALLGATTWTSGGDTHFTAGLDYEYRLPFLHGLLGVFAGGEVIMAHGTPLVFTAGLAVHPVGGLKVLAGVGTEFHAAHPDPHFLVRGGVGYDVHIGMLSLGPELLVDYVDEHVALVYGLTVGLTF